MAKQQGCPSRLGPRLCVNSMSRFILIAIVIKSTVATVPVPVGDHAELAAMPQQCRAECAVTRPDEPSMQAHCSLPVPSLHPVHQWRRRQRLPTRRRWRRLRGWSLRCARATCRARPRTLCAPQKQTPAAWQRWTRVEHAQLPLWPEVGTWSACLTYQPSRGRAPPMCWPWTQGEGLRLPWTAAAVIDTAAHGPPASFAAGGAPARKSRR